MSKRKKKGTPASRQRERHLRDLEQQILEPKIHTLTTTPDDKLFFVDTGQQNQQDNKKSKVRAKILHRDLLFSEKNQNTKKLKKPEQKLKRTHLPESKTQAKAIDQDSSEPRIVSYDIWTDTHAESSTSDWLESTKKPSFKVPGGSSAHVRPSTSVSVTSGASYHPDHEEHEDELGEALAQHLRRERHEKRITTLLNRRETKKRKRPYNEESDKEAEVHIEEKPKVNKPHIFRKTRAQRNRELKKKLNAFASRQKKREERTNRALDRIPQMLDNIERKEQEQEIRADYSKSIANKKRQSLRLGPIRYQPEQKQVLLPDELPSNLRSLKIRGSPLTDRFKTFQKKGVIETRVKVTPFRRYALKVVNKRNQ